MPAGALTTTLSLTDLPLDFFSDFLSFPFLTFVFGFSSAGGSAGADGFSSLESSTGASGDEDESTGGKFSDSETIVVFAPSDVSAGWSEESCGSGGTSPPAMSS